MRISKFKYQLLLAGSLCLLSACSQSSSERSQKALSGLWTAQWDTDPGAFPEVSDASIYTMNGSFNFVDEEVTVTAFGFPGCIFSTDTLSHSLNWILKNDTLSLVNEGDIYGMTYRVLDMNDEMVRLQLMDDITVTLSKEE
jgi:hypothetical protein